MSEEQQAYKTHWTPLELANAADVSKTWIYMQLRAGAIKGEKPGGRDWFIPDSEARRWLVEFKASREE